MVLTREAVEAGRAAHAGVPAAATAMVAINHSADLGPPSSPADAAPSPPLTWS